MFLVECCSVTPAYWVSLGSRPCSHPAVAAALLTAAAHVAGVDSSVQQQGQMRPPGKDQSRHHLLSLSCAQIHVYGRATTVSVLYRAALSSCISIK